MQSQPPATGPDGQVLEEPVAVLGKRMIKKNNAAEVQILVQWANLLLEEATWKIFIMSPSNFQLLILEDNDHLEGRGDVMNQAD